jgi:type VI protein secretion system component Hcp
MKRYRVVGALIACAVVAGLLALIGGTFGDGSAQAARAIQADKTAATLTIEGAEGANALEVQSYSWGVKNPVSDGSAGGGAGTGKATLTELTVTRAADGVSPRLFRAVATGEHFPSATLEARVGKTTLRYTFRLVFVTSLQHNGGGDGVAESLSLAYGSVTVEAVS